MIQFIHPLPVGNAIRVNLVPPATAKRWRLLRRTDDQFGDQDDPQAVLIHDGALRSVLDTAGLVNGTTYWYRAYYYDGATWTASAAASAIPSAMFTDESVDAIDVVIERMRLGLANEVAAARLHPPKGKALIEVLKAPPQFPDTPLPVVTVHCTQDSSAERLIGDDLYPDDLQDDGDWIEDEGWLSRWSMEIIGWTLNPDARATLRKSLKAIIAGNMGVFADRGLVQLEFEASDVEDFQTYGAPMYMVSCRLTCLAPTALTSVTAPIPDVESVVNGEIPRG